jgi:hypothetical protein
LSIQPDTPAYLKTWADEISSRANRVRNLIGDHHWLSDGTYKEFLVRELLTRHLPNFLTITRGFIRPIHRSDVCSREIDLLIADPSRHVPLFHEGGLQIVTPSAVLATIEVKSTYSSSVLKQAVGTVVETRCTLVDDREMQQVWSIVIFAEPGDAFSVANLMDATEKAIQLALNQQKPEKYSSADARQVLPQAIAVSNGALALVGPSETDGFLRVRVFEAGSLTLAIALAQLFAHVQSQFRRDPGASELDDLLRNFDAQDRLTVREVSTEVGCCD